MGRPAIPVDAMNILTREIVSFKSVNDAEIYIQNYIGKSINCVVQIKRYMRLAVPASAYDHVFRTPSNDPWPEVIERYARRFNKVVFPLYIENTITGVVTECLNYKQMSKVLNERKRSKLYYYAKNLRISNRYFRISTDRNDFIEGGQDDVRIQCLHRQVDAGVRC